MNNKGFAISGILYTLFTIFLVFITLMLFNLQNRKTLLDTLKLDSVEAVERDNNYEALLKEINQLKNKTSDVIRSDTKTQTVELTANSWKDLCFVRPEAPEGYRRLTQNYYSSRTGVSIAQAGLNETSSCVSIYSTVTGSHHIIMVTYFVKEDLY